MGRRGIVLRQFVSSEKALRAREMRRNPTPAEQHLWAQIRAGKQGFHFRRQQNVHGFIVDFYCHAVGIVIEVDGDIHDLQVTADAERSRVLRSLGLEVLRFRNDDVLEDVEGVLKRIVESCRSRRHDES